ncbi:enoyl-CoA hydratase [Marinobacter bryozoorum]|uniref:enoyl-CoA hydratase n=1 Tax=Marinobacter bryozoorum TaxID=256324 RepID=UPI00200334E0|nr:enoyl-CoA hydratase [Marinobacter bryozoorum]MCK7544954.1 enoyl-CoA hydratase [Marinobacter bryozoorum]
MSYEDILYRRDGHVATISLNRPDKLNAWTLTMEKEVRSAIEAADADDEVRAIIITGEGRGFCAGADMSLLSAVMEDSDADEAVEKKDDNQVDGIERNYRQKFSYLLRVSKPIVAAINGPCAGMGLCMSLFCDVRFMADHTKLTTAFARRGLVAEHGIAWMLPRLVGPMNAVDLLYSSRNVEAAEAEAMGLVWTLPEDGFLEKVQEWTTQLVTLSSPRSLRVMKRQIFDSLFQDLAESWEYADEEMLKSFSSEDFKEGVAHFMEKRAPKFTGR